MTAGIGTYTYTWAIGVPGSVPDNPMTACQLIDRAVEMAIACVQVADNLPLISMDKMQLEEIRAYARNRHISIEVGGRGLIEKILDRYIDLADFFGSPILRMVIDLDDFKPDADAVIAIIRNALPKLSAKKIILALENHDRLSAAVFKRIVETVDSEWAGICLDCVNSIGCGEGLETVKSNLAAHTVNLHVKDFTVKRVSHKMGFVVEGTPAGKGFLDIPALIQELKPLNRCRSAILELWTPPAATLEETLIREDEWARESAEYLRQFTS